MSILIKGMAMPKNCGECPFLEATSCEADGRDYKCTRTGLYTTPRIRFIRCPLVELPPHGDLIDRDPFIEFIKTHWDRYDQWFAEQLEARPTIIPAEDGK